MPDEFTLEDVVALDVKSVASDETLSLVSLGELEEQDPYEQYQEALYSRICFAVNQRSIEELPNEVITAMDHFNVNLQWDKYFRVKDCHAHLHDLTTVEEFFQCIIHYRWNYNSYIFTTDKRSYLRHLTVGGRCLYRVNNHQTHRMYHVECRPDCNQFYVRKCMVECRAKETDQLCSYIAQNPWMFFCWGCKKFLFDAPEWYLPGIIDEMYQVGQWGTCHKVENIIALKDVNTRKASLEWKIDKPIFITQGFSLQNV